MNGCPIRPIARTSLAFVDPAVLESDQPLFSPISEVLSPGYLQLDERVPREHVSQTGGLTDRTASESARPIETSSEPVPELTDGTTDSESLHGPSEPGIQLPLPLATTFPSESMLATELVRPWTVSRSRRASLQHRDVTSPPARRTNSWPFTRNDLAVLDEVLEHYQDGSEDTAGDGDTLEQN
ncbi:hypothetical protein AMS68_004659 [Peltaster fructicola]|uniref:Uncharacterized protein n=1 Tax=Peltaster fructicola TaxID=286661 RepID=A0A6H0XWJ4_9PEZI|nr:hypothetical protein AMS68_004659 [Peltaster fructicola]